LPCPLLLADDNSAGAKNILSSFLAQVGSLCQVTLEELKQMNSQNAKEKLQGFLEILEKQINLVGQQSESVEWRHRIATELMALVEKLLRTLALTVRDRISITSPNGTELGLAFRQAGNQSQETVTLQQSKTQMELKWAGAPGQKNEGFMLVGLLTYQGMSPILDGAGRVEAPEWDKIGRTGKWAQELGRPSYRVLSPVVSAFISDPNPQALGLSVSIRFSHPVPEKKTDLRLLCAYWEPGSRRWATDGCTLQKLNATITRCQCNHLTSFAVLMAFYELEDWTLDVITKVGLVISLLCLLLAIVTFLFCRALKGPRTTIHLHLCLALFIAYTVFLTGTSSTGNKVVCGVVAGLLHYFFLAAFCWMCLEGAELYLLVVQVFTPHGLRRRYMFLLGYGVPALIVGVSAATYSEGYGTARHCPSPNPPLPCPRQVNAVIFVVTVWKLSLKFADINPDMSQLKKLSKGQGRLMGRQPHTALLLERSSLRPADSVTSQAGKLICPLLLDDDSSAGAKDWTLDVITKVGLVISLLCLLLAIVTFLFCRALKGPRTTIHLHLCLALFIAYTVFLTGTSSTGNKVNAVIFVVTVWKLSLKFADINPNMSQLKKLRVLTITAIAQLCVLGTTWIFGMFQFSQRSLVASYIFTILNSLQGLFIFLLHCLLKKQAKLTCPPLLDDDNSAEAKDWTLDVITKVGLVISLLCLLLAIVTFLFCRALKGPRTTIHLHLCLALFIAYTVFLTGTSSTGNKVVCGVVAGLLHYFFLAAFCWMCLEGAELYLLVVQVFTPHGLRRRYMFLLGYGVPALIVGVSAATYSQGYGTARHCPPPNPPLPCPRQVNAVIFVVTVWKLSLKFADINPDMSQLKKLRFRPQPSWAGPPTPHGAGPGSGALPSGCSSVHAARWTPSPRSMDPARCLLPLGLCIALCLWGTVAQTPGVQGTTGDCNNHLLCPANATCVNSTHCTCLDGYQPTGNHFFTDPTETCDELQVTSINSSAEFKGIKETCRNFSLQGKWSSRSSSFCSFFNSTLEILMSTFGDGSTALSLE
ncbi:hypothetical protein KIL84_020708, partial [Mauremys mutica]